MKGLGFIEVCRTNADNPEKKQETFKNTYASDPVKKRKHSRKLMPVTLRNLKRLLKKVMSVIQKHLRKHQTKVTKKIQRMKAGF